MNEARDGGQHRSSLKFWWSAIGLAALLAVVASWIAWSLFVKTYPDYAVGDFLGFWGVVLGLMGVTVSILGFGFGLAQLRRTQTASRAVALTVEQIRKSYTSLDIFQLLSRAKELTKQAREHLSGARYTETAACYSELRENLWRMGSTKGVLLSRRSDDLKDLAGKALEAYPILTAKARDAKVEFDTGAFERWLQVTDNTLTEIDLELRSEAHGW